MVLYLVPPRIDVPRILHLSFFQETTFHSGQMEFAEIDSIDVAEQVLGCHLLMEANEAIARALIDGSGLVGFQVIDAAAGPLGSVVDIMDSGAQQVLVIETAEEGMVTVMVPLVDEFIESVDDGVVRTSCPPSLLSLG